MKFVVFYIVFVLINLIDAVDPFDRHLSLKVTMCTCVVISYTITIPFPRDRAILAQPPAQEKGLGS